MIPRTICRAINPAAAGKAEAIANIRETAAAFGYSLDHLTDEQIEAGVARFGQIVRAAGITTQQLTRAFGEGKE